MSKERFKAIKTIIARVRESAELSTPEGREILADSLAKLKTPIRLGKKYGDLSRKEFKKLKRKINK